MTMRHNETGHEKQSYTAPEIEKISILCEQVILSTSNPKEGEPGEVPNIWDFGEF